MIFVSLNNNTTDTTSGAGSVFFLSIQLHPRLLVGFVLLNLQFSVQYFVDHCFPLRTTIYDKRYDFNFPIVNFPFICSNIPAAPVYGVYIFHFRRCSRAYDSYQDFLDNGLLLRRKLLNQGFLLVKLKASLRKFYGRLHNLVGRYGISVSQMTRDMFHLS